MAAPIVGTLVKGVLGAAKGGGGGGKKGGKGGGDQGGSPMGALAQAGNLLKG
ncbi:hypothetical protein IV102_16620 [bacterium]|nr:hypothetical protein [bacterium]